MISCQKLVLRARSYRIVLTLLAGLALCFQGLATEARAYLRSPLESVFPQGPR